MTSTTITAQGYCRNVAGMSSTAAVCADDPSQCKGMKNGAVFLIGSGKSAQDFPIQEFADTPMIAMNGAVAKFSGTGIDPFFYVCSDRNFPRQQPELYAAAMRSSVNVALWTDQLRQGHPMPNGRAYALKKAPKVSAIAALFKQDKALVRKRAWFSRRSQSIGFSKDLSHGFFDARTVMYLAIQLAHHLGFNRVFLVGFDLDPAAGRFYETADTPCSPCDLDEHFHTRILPSLKLMARQVVNTEFQVFNLSATSRVPTGLVPKISIDVARRMIAG